MKFIFDFDDVLFNNTKQFKEHMFKIISDTGVSNEEARAYYLEVREKEFSLKNFIKTLFSRYHIDANKIDSTYVEIMKMSPNFVNTEILELVKRVGKENCYIVTNGEKEFNQDKIDYSGMGNFFREIFIVPGTKKEIIMRICKKNSTEEVYFIDDKLKFIEDIDPNQCPNLKTILYKNQNLQDILN